MRVLKVSDIRGRNTQMKKSKSLVVFTGAINVWVMYYVNNVGIPHLVLWWV